MADNEPTSISEIVAEYQAKQSAFERHLWELWKPGFDVFDWFLLQARHAAGFFLENHRAEAVEQQDVLYEAQTRLHTRAYRTACEVRALLLSGNPAGALARWRTMHEILIVMRFLQKHGVETAERFLKYDLVQTAKNVEQYEKLPEEWRIVPITPEEGKQIKTDRDEVVRKYGRLFNKGNGWAAHALGKTDGNSQIKIEDLEENVGLGPFHFYYNIASNHIHVNMKGLADTYYADLYASMNNFSAPAHMTLLQLAECTIIMAQLRPTPGATKLEQTLNQAVADASQAFLRIQQQIDGKIV